MITADQLKAIFPATSTATLANIVDPLNKTLAQYGINTQRFICEFLAEVGEESGGFQFYIENLNYSAQGLLNTFPTHFTAAEVNNYARQPQKIANRVYANRMGNGDEASGEGWQFRGSGFLQVTGKDNYTLLANALNKSLDDTIMYIRTVEGAMVSAGWFWNLHNLNNQPDLPSSTKIINGGLNGESDREAIYARALSVIPIDITLDVPAPIIAPQPIPAAVVTQPADTSGDGSAPSVLSTIIAQGRSILGPILSKFNINI